MLTRTAFAEGGKVAALKSNPQRRYFPLMHRTPKVRLVLLPLFLTAANFAGAADYPVPERRNELPQFLRNTNLQSHQVLSNLPIKVIEPPDNGFFSKVLDFHGIPIKAHKVVSDEALYAAYERLALLFSGLLEKQPMVISNLVAAGAELHIIGRDQVTSDLPEWRHDKGKKLAEYHGRTRDERTRGMGGLLTSCGEENLLRMANDRYHGRDICLHEFAHNIRNHGIQKEVRARLNEQYRRSLAQGLWQKSYAGSNPDEFFAELTMWYFGTHGDLHMTGPKPVDGPDGLKQYDPDAYALLDDFYSGRITITRVDTAW
jgi:hypothetical protein